MRVFIIRHGESEANKNHVWSGQLDFPLTERGRKDAEGARVILSGVVFDKIYASDLSRAKNTAEIAIPGCEYEIRPELREVDTGRLMGTPIIPFTEEEKLSLRKIGYKTFGGESKEDMRKRVKGFMEELEKSSYQSVAVFCHAGWQRTFLDLVVGTDLPTENVRCKNCTVAIFEYEKSVWELHSWINLC